MCDSDSNMIFNMYVPRYLCSVSIRYILKWGREFSFSKGKSRVVKHFASNIVESMIKNWRSKNNSCANEFFYDCLKIIIIYAESIIPSTFLFWKYTSLFFRIIPYMRFHFCESITLQVYVLKGPNSHLMIYRVIKKRAKSNCVWGELREGSMIRIADVWMRSCWIPVCCTGVNRRRMNTPSQ